MKAILFDFGNVLGSFDHHKACKQLSTYTDVSADVLYHTLCIGEEASRRQTGQQSAEEFFVFARENFKLTAGCDFETFQAIWGDIFTSAPAEMNQLLSQIVPGVQCCIASNTEALHWPYIAKLPIVQQFADELRFRSFQLGFEKPDPRFFETILQRLQVDAREALFIDDVPSNVETFKMLGGTAEVFNLQIDKPGRLFSILRSHDLLQ